MKWLSWEQSSDPNIIKSPFHMDQCAFLQNEALSPWEKSDPRLSNFEFLKKSMKICAANRTGKKVSDAVKRMTRGSLSEIPLCVPRDALQHNHMDDATSHTNDTPAKHGAL